MRHGAHCAVISASDTGIMASSLASHRQWERMVLRIGRTRIQTHNDLCSTLSTLSSDLNARKKLSDNKALLHLLSHFPFLSFFLSFRPYIEALKSIIIQLPFRSKPPHGRFANQSGRPSLSHMQPVCSRTSIPKRIQSPSTVCEGDELEFPMNLTQLLQRSPQTHH